MYYHSFLLNFGCLRGDSNIFRYQRVIVEIIGDRGIFSISVLRSVKQMLRNPYCFIMNSVGLHRSECAARAGCREDTHCLLQHCCRCVY